MADLTAPPTANSTTTGGVSTSAPGIQRGFDANNKYQIQNFSYPTDLFRGTTTESTRDPQIAKASSAINSYVIFYINVTEESVIAKNPKNIVLNGAVDRAVVNRTDQNTIQNGGVGDLEQFASVATSGAAITSSILSIPGAASSAASSLFQPGKAVARFLRAGTDFLASAGQAAAAGAAVGYIQSGVALEGLEVAGIKASGKIVRLKTAVALHVPQNYMVGYRVNYADEEMGVLFGNAAAAARGQGAGGLEGGARAAILGLASRSDAMPALNALTRATINPRREQLFRSVDNRRFTFEYQFAPRNETEAANIRRIINTFKYHMHPEYLSDTNRMAYLVPSEFDIVHMFGEQENTKMNKISTCVLAEMSVNYSPNGQFSTHADGMPTQINMQLTFIELETLTKERLMDVEDLSSPDGATF